MPLFGAYIRGLDLSEMPKSTAQLPSLSISSNGYQQSSSSIDVASSSAGYPRALGLYKARNLFGLVPERLLLRCALV